MPSIVVQDQCATPEFASFKLARTDGRINAVAAGADDFCGAIDRMGAFLGGVLQIFLHRW